MDVSDRTETGVYGIENTSRKGYIALNATLENLGSIGCRYRLRGEFNRSDGKDTVWSKSSALWPGDTALLRIDYLAVNYTGEVQASFFAEYCGREEKFKEISFDVNELRLPNGTQRVEVESSNSTSAIVETGVEKGYMVPVDGPGGWKLSSSRIENSEAVLSYEAPIFDRERNLTYLVVDRSGSVKKAEFSLEPEKSLMQKIRSLDLWPLLVASLVLNFLLISGFESRIRRN